MGKPSKKEEYNEETGEVATPADKIARETMTGDLRDCLLDFLKHEKNLLPWNMRGEAQQREVIEKVTRAVSHAVEKAVAIIAADGRSVIRGTLDKVTVKDGIKAEITMSRHDPLRHAMTDAQGNVVLMVVSNSDSYTGEKKAALPDPDQSTLLTDHETND